MLNKKKLNIINKLTFKKKFEKKKITKIISTINLPSSYFNENFINYSNRILKINTIRKKYDNFCISFLGFLKILNIFFLRNYPLRLYISKIHVNKVELNFFFNFQRYFNIRIFLLNTDLSKLLLNKKINKFYIYHYNFNFKLKKIIIIVKLNKF